MALHPCFFVLGAQYNFGGILQYKGKVVEQRVLYHGLLNFQSLTCFIRLLKGPYLRMSLEAGVECYSINGGQTEHLPSLRENVGLYFQ